MVGLALLNNRNKRPQQNNRSRLWVSFSNCCLYQISDLANHKTQGTLILATIDKCNFSRKTHVYFLGNKVKGRISKRVFQENKARQILRHFLPLDAHKTPRVLTLSLLTSTSSATSASLIEWKVKVWYSKHVEKY